jgi:hypothetical protein
MVAQFTRSESMALMQSYSDRISTQSLFLGQSVARSLGSSTLAIMHRISCQITIKPARNTIKDTDSVLAGNLAEIPSRATATAGPNSTSAHKIVKLCPIISFAGACRGS